MRYKILYFSVFLPEISVEEIDEKELEEFVENYFGELFPFSLIPARASDELRFMVEGRSDRGVVHIKARDYDHPVRIISRPAEGEYTRALIFFDETNNKFLGLWLVKAFV